MRDLREVPELLRDKFGGARRFVAPRPANKLLRSEGLLKNKNNLSFFLCYAMTDLLHSFLWEDRDSNLRPLGLDGTRTSKRTSALKVF